jgi:hypothetical protein
LDWTCFRIELIERGYAELIRGVWLDYKFEVTTARKALYEVNKLWQVLRQKDLPYDIAELMPDVARSGHLSSFGTITYRSFSVPYFRTSFYLS